MKDSPYSLPSTPELFANDRSLFKSSHMSKVTVKSLIQSFEKNRLATSVGNDFQSSSQQKEAGFTHTQNKQIFTTSIML